MSVERSKLNVERSNNPASSVDADNPWPGLASFTEDARSFFFGREVETDQLSRLVRRQTLTVLFGQSGLGKSSLLQAGLFPILRESDHLPLYLRLDHAPTAASLIAQVKLALNGAFAEAKADAPAFRDDETLWEYFHRKDVDIWSAKNRLLTPVLAFDQFEEIFTLGRGDEICRERSRAFLSELACLVENRPPVAVKTKLDAGELDPARFNFEKPSCQVILSLREDFLPDLEGLRQEMPALIHNRLRLKKLSGTQALEIVSRPAPHLLAEGVAERIVEFVAGGRGGSAERLAELDVEPPLLSVICRELNERRRTLGHAQITADLVSGNRREILTDFYERSVADLPDDMRTFVEDHLLTKSGFRDNIALETALEFPGVTRELIDTLVGRRLLRIEDRFGVQRVELTHDVLADVIRASRDTRQQDVALAEAARHTRRLRWVVAGLVAVVLGLSVGAVFGIRAQRLAAQRAGRTDLEFSTQLMDGGDAPTAIARIVRAAHSDPHNPVVGTRLISALARHSWPMWQDTGAVLPAPTFGLSFSPDGKTIDAFGRDNVLRLLDSESLRVVREIHLPAEVLNAAWAQQRPNLLAVALADGTATLIDGATGTVRRALDSGIKAILPRIALSPDGRWLAYAIPKKTLLIDATDGRVIAETTYPETHNPSSLNFSADSSRVIMSDWDYGFEILRASTGEVLVPWIHPSTFNVSGAGYAAFHPDGKTAIVCWFQGAALFDTTTGQRISPLFHTGAQSDFALFDGDGKRVITLSQDRTARIWDTATLKELVPPMRHGAVVLGAQLSKDGHTLLVRSHDGFVHLWDTTNGQPLIEPTLSVRSSLSIALDPAGDRALFAAPDHRLMTLETKPTALHPLVWRPTDAGFRPPGGDVINFDTWFPPDQPRVFRHFGSAGIRDYSVETGSPTAKIEPPPARIDIRDVDANGVYLASSPESGWSVWQVRDHVPEKVADLVEVPKDAQQAWFDQKSGLIVITTGSGVSPKTVRLWRRSDGRPAGPTLSLATPILGDSITISSDGTRITLGTWTAAGIWEIATGRQLVSFQPTIRANYHAVMLSPDGKVVATGTYTGGDPVHAEARLWDARTGQPISPVISHRESIAGVSFSPDSRLVAIASIDGTVDVVSTATGEAVCPPLVHPGALPGQGGNPYGSPARFLGTDSIVSDSVTGLSWWDAHSGLPLMEPLPLGPEPIARFRVDASGRFVMVVASSGRVHFWPLPPQYENTPVPEWLERLATALAGVKLDDNGVLAPVAGGFARTQEELAAIRHELAGLPDDAPFAEWGRWLLADPAKRPIAPGFKITSEAAEKLDAP